MPDRDPNIVRSPLSSSIRVLGTSGMLIGIAIGVVCGLATGSPAIGGGIGGGLGTLLGTGVLNKKRPVEGSSPD